MMSRSGARVNVDLVFEMRAFGVPSFDVVVRENTEVPAVTSTTERRCNLEHHPGHLVLPDDRLYDLLEM
jgi:hypothetical protein